MTSDTAEIDRRYEQFVDNIYKKYWGCRPCIKLFVDDYCLVFEKSKLIIVCSEKFSKIGKFFDKTRGRNWPHYYPGFCEPSIRS